MSTPPSSPGSSDITDAPPPQPGARRSRPGRGPNSTGIGAADTSSSRSSRVGSRPGVVEHHRERPVLRPCLKEAAHRASDLEARASYVARQGLRCARRRAPAWRGRPVAVERPRHLGDRPVVAFLHASRRFDQRGHPAVRCRNSRTSRDFDANTRQVAIHGVPPSARSCRQVAGELHRPGDQQDDRCSRPRPVQARRRAAAAGADRLPSCLQGGRATGPLHDRRAALSRHVIARESCSLLGPPTLRAAVLTISPITTTSVQCSGSTMTCEHHPTCARSDRQQVSAHRPVRRTDFAGAVGGDTAHGTLVSTPG